MSFLPEFLTPQLIQLACLLLATGVLGGFLAGLLGIGGGTVYVPALFFLFTSLGLHGDHAMHIAVGTSLAAVFVTGIVSSRAHYRRDAVEVTRVRSWGPSLVAGVALGGVLAASINGDVLRQTFAGLTFLIAIYMAAGTDKTAEQIARLPAFLSVRVQKELCVLIGVVSAMIGVGGAILTVPLMAYTGLPIRRAVGTGALLGVVVAFPAMLVYMISGSLQAEALPKGAIGYVNFIAAGLLACTSLLAAGLGVRAAHRLPKHLLRRVFAVVLMLVSVRMLVDL